MLLEVAKRTGCLVAPPFVRRLQCYAQFPGTLSVSSIHFIVWLLMCYELCVAVLVNYVLRVMLETRIWCAGWRLRTL